MWHKVVAGMASFKGIGFSETMVNLEVSLTRHRSSGACLTVNDISEKASANLVEFEEEDSTTWDFRPD